MTSLIDKFRKGISSSTNGFISKDVPVVDKSKKYVPVHIQETDIKKIILKHNTQDITKNYIRTWIDLKRIPYRYEFTGLGFMNAVNPDQIVVTK